VVWVVVVCEEGDVVVSVDASAEVGVDLMVPPDLTPPLALPSNALGVTLNVVDGDDAERICVLERL
jgi:hypothetical protein